MRNDLVMYCQKANDHATCLLNVLISNNADTGAILQYFRLYKE